MARNVSLLLFEELSGRKEKKHGRQRTYTTTDVHETRLSASI